MNNIQDTANQALQQMLTMVVNSLQGAVDLSKAQIPDVVHQMLVWNAITSVITQVVCLFIISLCIIVPYKVNKYSEYDKDVVFGCVAVALMISFFTLTALFKHGDWLQILVAPKYYILQQAAHLVKS